MSHILYWLGKHDFLLVTNQLFIPNDFYRQLYWVVLYTDESVFAFYILLIKKNMYKYLDFMSILLELIKTLGNIGKINQ